VIPAQLPAVIDPSLAGMPPRQWTEFTRERKVVFLEALADRGDVRAAARAARISHHTAYRARRSDAAFRQAWTGALLAARVHAEATLEARAIDGVEEEVLATRAIDGVEEEVRYRGEVVATRRRYDGRLLLAHLARLDKLTEDARTAAFAEDFETALGRFAAGEPQPDPPAGDGGKCSSRQCANCAKSNSPAEAEARETVAEVRRAMAADRPSHALGRHDFEVLGYDWQEVEAEQRRAFAAGAEEWWMIVPPPDDDTEAAGVAENGYCYL